MSKQPTSAVSQTDWARLDAMQDEDIDLSEVPEVTEEQMARAVLRVGCMLSHFEILLLHAHYFSQDVTPILGTAPR